MAILEIGGLSELLQGSERVVALDDAEHDSRVGLIGAHGAVVQERLLQLFHHPVDGSSRQLRSQITVEWAGTTTLLHVTYKSQWGIQIEPCASANIRKRTQNVHPSRERVLAFLRVESIKEIRRVIIIGLLVPDDYEN